MSEREADLNEVPRFPSIHIELDSRVNFAMQQNDVPVVKSLVVRNSTTREYLDLRVRITSEPPFSKAWDWRLERLAPESSIETREVDLDLDPVYLGELTERVRGRLTCTVTSRGEKLSEEIFRVDCLARNEWGGVSSLPEILAAFVLPNHPAIEPVLRKASELIGQKTGDSSLSGYQSKSVKRVAQISAAIYAALQSESLSYINPPTSFELEGQRVRLPDHILQAKMGTPSTS